jgi:GNAT superfamily N-acetyltransferase
MAMDLHQVRDDSSGPAGLQIEVDNAGVWEVDDLPYYTRPENGSLPSSRAFRPQWRLGAWLNGKVVGQTVVHMTYGRLGVAGIYNVGVVPAARRQGIGRAITAAACRLARELGAHYALLNAATHIYERIGFVSLGYGQTWFLRPEVLSAPPSTPVQIAFFEAVGKGHRPALTALRRTHPDFDLDTELPNGMTLIALGVRLQKPHLVRWLISQGARLDIIHAWEMGWHKEAERLVREQPDLVNRPVGQHGMTPLHDAAARNDVGLARLILTAKPDLTLRDRQYNGTPLNWAEILGRPIIAQMIREYAESRA